MNLNKGISTSVAILIIVVIAALVGGVFYWQSEEIRKGWRLKILNYENSLTKTTEEASNYPEDYILQKEEIPSDYQYAVIDKNSSVGKLLGDNPGYLNWPKFLTEEKAYQGINLTEIESIYKAIYGSGKEISFIYIWAVKYNSEAEMKRTKETIDTVEGFASKVLYLKGGEKVLVIVDGGGSKTRSREQSVGCS
ncbi:MAG: hypothetical protein V5A57_00225 [Candidatus Paceibacterota bacterium]